MTSAPLSPTGHPAEHPCIEPSPESKNDLNDGPDRAGAEGLRWLAAARQRRMEV